jgi:peptidoglycan hydrolase-like protein with peptidoglycan-binding domain
MTSFQLLAVPKIETTSPSFRSELVRQALDIGLDPNLVAAVISFESGFNPQAVNRYSGATGLIQWMPQNFPRPNLLALSAEQQLPLAIAWFKAHGAAGSTRATDYYLSVFLPAFIGAPSNLTVGRKDSTEPLRLPNGKATSLSLAKMYAQNPAFDTSGKGYFTIGDIGKKIETLVSTAQGRAPIPVPLPVAAPPRPRSPGKVDASSSQRQQPPVLSARIGSSRTVFREKEPAVLPRLERGSHGPAVLLLQRLLWATQPEGDDRAIDFDGEFGAQTEIWVALHQHDAELPPDGIVGPRTWEAFTLDAMWGPDRMGLATLDSDRDDFFDRDIEVDLGAAPTLIAPAPDAARLTEPFELSIAAALPKPPKTPR